MAIRTIDVDKIAERVGNLYEAVVIMAKRARQISANMKAELDEKLSYFDEFELDKEDIQMREERRRVSIQFEKMPKPTEQAIDEMLKDEIYYRRPEPEEEGPQLP